MMGTPCKSGLFFLNDHEKLRVRGNKLCSKKKFIIRNRGNSFIIWINPAIATLASNIIKNNRFLPSQKI